MKQGTKIKKDRVIISILFSAVLALSLALVGCSSSGESESQANLTTLKLQGLGGSPNNTEAATIGVAQGYFKE